MRVCSSGYLRIPFGACQTLMLPFLDIEVVSETGLNARGWAEHLARLDLTDHWQLPRLSVSCHFNIYMYTFNLFQMHFWFELLEK
jgi:hypothetical protein